MVKGVLSHLPLLQKVCELYIEFSIINGERNPTCQIMKEAARSLCVVCSLLSLHGCCNSCLTVEN